MATWLLVAYGSLAPSATAQELRFFDIRDFRLESGSTLPVARVAYATLGTLNADRSNAIVLPSHYAADHKGYDYLIGDGKTLDPKRYFLILTNLFANGVSSSPSNTTRPLDGPRFPAITLRDNVRAQHELLRTKLGVTRVKAVVGFSMGGQQAYQWAASHPELVENIAVICGNAKQYPFGVVRLQGSIAALKADGEFRGGNYTVAPTRGLRAFAIHYRGWALAPGAWPRDQFDRLGPAELSQFLDGLEEGFTSLDANNLLSQAETWKRHDISHTPGQARRIEQTLATLKAKVLLMPCESDQYFPLADAEFEAKHIRAVTLAPIKSVMGHTAGGGNDPTATQFINTQLRTLLEPPPAPTP